MVFLCSTVGRGSLFFHPPGRCTINVAIASRAQWDAIVLRTKRFSDFESTSKTFIRCRYLPPYREVFKSEKMSNTTLFLHVLVSTTKLDVGTTLNSVNSRLYLPF